jgi:hypothetical protein
MIVIEQRRKRKVAAGENSLQRLTAFAFVGVFSNKYDDTFKRIPN